MSRWLSQAAVQEPPGRSEEMAGLKFQVVGWEGQRNCPQMHLGDTGALQVMPLDFIAFLVLTPARRAPFPRPAHKFASLVAAVPKSRLPLTLPRPPLLL